MWDMCDGAMHVVQGKLRWEEVCEGIEGLVATSCSLSPNCINVGFVTETVQHGFVLFILLGDP